MTAPTSALNPGQGKPAHKPGTQFVARQPILTADEKVFGYELLFRDGVEGGDHESIAIESYAGGFFEFLKTKRVFFNPVETF